jgi:hypothetical protein
MDQFKPSQRLRIMQDVLLHIDPAQVNMRSFLTCHIGHFYQSPEGQSMGLGRNIFQADTYETLANALGVSDTDLWKCFNHRLTREESLARFAALIAEVEAKESVHA